MNDLINRQDAINLLKKWSDGYKYIETETELAIKEFKYLPSAQPEPKRRGRWVEHPYEREWDICSCCKIGTKRREFGVTDDGREWVIEESYTYCPWCGAKMEEQK